MSEPSEALLRLYQTASSLYYSRAMRCRDAGEQSCYDSNMAIHNDYATKAKDVERQLLLQRQLDAAAASTNSTVGATETNIPTSTEVESALIAQTTQVGDRVVQQFIGQLGLTAPTLARLASGGSLINVMRPVVVAAKDAIASGTGGYMYGPDAPAVLTAYLHEQFEAGATAENVASQLKDPNLWSMVEAARAAASAPPEPPPPGPTMDATQLEDAAMSTASAEAAAQATINAQPPPEVAAAIENARPNGATTQSMLSVPQPGQLMPAPKDDTMKYVMIGGAVILGALVVKKAMA